MSHSFESGPCCCPDCPQFNVFVRGWFGVGLAIRNPHRTQWLLGLYPMAWGKP